jgi:hypothetical protein
MFKDEDFRADMIKTESDAVTFYYSCVVGNGIVWETDRGLYKADGRPAIKDADEEALKTLNEANVIARQILAEQEIDAQEVMDMCESILVCNLVLDVEADLDGLPSRKIKGYANETEEQKTMRRYAHLWEIMQSTLEICVPDFIKSDVGIAVPRGFHPVIDAYVSSCTSKIPVETTTAPYTDDKEMVIEDMITEGKRLEKEGKLQPRDWDSLRIDPDSDENDDDPFSSGMWA